MKLPSCSSSIRFGPVAWLLLFGVGSAMGRIAVHDDIDEGQACWRIETPSATYFYHKEGAGFSSLLDRHGNDWIDYHPGGGSEGEFRGIPNMVFNSNGNYFHPGHSGEKGSRSAIEVLDDRVIIVSTSGNEAWQCRWEIFSTHATMTVERVDGAYWFLYEGTPGGGYDLEQDWYLLSDGTRHPVSTDHVGDFPDPEWIVFGEEGLGTVLFLAHHTDDAISDTYMNWGKMTVFGFGRAGRDDYTGKMTASGEQFTIGFLETNGAITPDDLDPRIRAALGEAPTVTTISTEPADPVTDFDGNVYPTIRIGEQVWMAANLRTTHFNDGTPIPMLPANEAWPHAEGAAASWIPAPGGGNDERAGVLYNADAVQNKRLAPHGWRVPTDDDWKVLERALGLSAEAAEEPGWRGEQGPLLAGGTEAWVSGALRDDPRFATSGFEGLPSGNRIGASGTFGNQGTNSYWWTATPADEDSLWFRSLYYGSTHLIRQTAPRRYGLAVRCVRE